MKNVFIIQNPVAGTTPGEEVEEKIRQHFEAFNWSYEIYQTTGEENVTEIVRQSSLDKRDLIVAAGGDGTISAVASALVGQNIPLGILPVGTGNGLARDLQIPLNLEQALALISGEHRRHPVDAMEVDGRYFLLNLSAGLTPSAIRLASREEKQRFGQLAYYIAGLRALFGIQPVSFILEVDGKPYSRKASELLLMNSVTLGQAGRFLNLGIENDDGELDLFIIEARSMGDYLRVFWNLLLRRPHQAPDVEHSKVRDKLMIRTRHLLEVQADGELIGYTPKTIQLVPAAVNVIVPEEQPPSLGEQIISQLPIDL